MGWYSCNHCNSQWRTTAPEVHAMKDCPGESEEFKLRAELAKVKTAFSKNVHTLYDLLVESDAPTKQYDYKTRKNRAIEQAQKDLKELA